jgi:hypothetical protein
MRLRRGPAPDGDDQPEILLENAARNLFSELRAAESAYAASNR